MQIFTAYMLGKVPYWFLTKKKTKTKTVTVDTFVASLEGKVYGWRFLTCSQHPTSLQVLRTLYLLSLPLDLRRWLTQGKIIHCVDSSRALRTQRQVSTKHKANFSYRE